MGPGDNTLDFVQTLLEALLNISLTSACISDKNFPGKSKISGLGTTLLKCEIFQDLWISGHWIKGILLIHSFPDLFPERQLSYKEELKM